MTEKTALQLIQEVREALQRTHDGEARMEGCCGYFAAKLAEAERGVALIYGANQLLSKENDEMERREKSLRAAVEEEEQKLREEAARVHRRNQSLPSTYLDYAPDSTIEEWADALRKALDA